MIRSKQPACLLFAALLLCSCEKRERLPPVMQQLTTRPQQYSAAGMRARVVDDRTGGPIPDAVVLVLWRKIDTYRQTFGGVYAHHEVVTGDDGSFEVPRWGPRTLHYDYYLDARDPEIWVLKRGYLLGYFDNTGTVDPRVFRTGGVLDATRISKAPPGTVPPVERQRYARGANGASVWHNRTLALHRASSPEEAARSLALTAPLDTHELSRIEMNRFWQEWTEARDALPEPSRKGLEEPPLPLFRRQPAP